MGFTISAIAGHELVWRGPWAGQCALHPLANRYVKSKRPACSILVRNKQENEPHILFPCDPGTSSCGWRAHCFQIQVIHKFCSRRDAASGLVTLLTLAGNMFCRSQYCSRVPKAQAGRHLRAGVAMVSLNAWNYFSSSFGFSGV